MRHKIIWLIVVLVLFVTVSCREENIKWSIVLEQPGNINTEIGHFYELPEDSLKFNRVVDGITVKVFVKKKDGFSVFNVEAESETEKQCIITLKADYKSGIAFSYNGQVENNRIFRQSPHDPTNHGLGGLVKQAIPMIAVEKNNSFWVALNDCPAFYNNFTTQTYNTQNQTLALSSGDLGNPGGSDTSSVIIREYYHTIKKQTSHTFNGIIFESKAADLNNLRKDVLFAIANRWGDEIISRFGATAFATNYMLIRKNETGNSEYWVVPGIPYANKQYTRDAFWQSMVLPAKYSEECYRNEAVALSPGAERPLFCMIWAYRTKLDGGQPDMGAAKKTLEYIENHTRNGWFYSSNDPSKKDFQSWYDLVPFDEDDVVTYNQGLLAVALMSAQALGLETKTSPDLAIKIYQSMFKEAGGYFPLSLKKDLLAVDPLVGDLLAQVYFNQPLLKDESVVSHFSNVVTKAKTDFGYKVTCLPDGNYAPSQAYCVEGHSLNWDDPGHYQHGGSWYLYDMLFLVASYLHNAPGALDEIKWRGALDFKLGGTYFEHNHTVTGKTDKENQGWNAAIYAIWQKLIADGKADESFFDTIDKI